jgi:hypothetical protein
VSQVPPEAVQAPAHQDIESASVIDTLRQVLANDYESGDARPRGILPQWRVGRRARPCSTSIRRLGVLEGNAIRVWNLLGPLLIVGIEANEWTGHKSGIEAQNRSVPGRPEDEDEI